MERIPILQMGQLLLVTIQVDMNDRLALTLQEDLTARIQQKGSKGVLIDISAMSRLLDAKAVLVGMQPAVAITLVELGLTLAGVRTALNVEKGMALLRSSIAAEEPDAGHGD